MLSFHPPSPHPILLRAAGYETTSSALAFAIYSLARHPRAEALLLQELDAFGRLRVRWGVGRTMRGRRMREYNTTMLALAAVPTACSPFAPCCARVTQEPSASHLSSFPYTLAVIHESLRLYPPAHTTTRECTAPQGCTISSATQQYFIPHGTWIHISVFSVHHSESLWRDPFAFRYVLRSAGRHHQTTTACNTSHCALPPAQLIG